ncbi:uncharacterized protein LOC111675407 [Lucilia cuprina]|uniref:uncharacterized protein LOC111675407 n=1 Tax=Lucilia cuprina TaxID=7375 RepID=UPI001F065991|nr:uncharacterized protein LOC111675407 [Lucilia cuprina]
MVFETLTIKSILLILNSLNIVRAIIEIILTLFNSDPNSFLFMNYITMLISGICCAAAVMESFLILQISANIFLSEIIATAVLWVYTEDLSLHLYTLFVLILHGIITGVAYYMAERMQMSKINNLISKYTGVAAIPLNPPPHVRSDVI